MQNKIAPGGFIPAALIMLFLTACSNFRGTDKIPVCNDMHNNSSEMNALEHEIGILEKKRIELSKHPEQNHEEMQKNESLLRQKKNREETLIKINQRAASDCRPMFDDPARRRAKRNEY